MTNLTMTLQPGDTLTVTVPGGTSPPTPPPDPTPNPTPPPPPPTPGGTLNLNNFYQRPIAMTYPQGSNADLDFSGPFGIDDALILSFTTPALSDGRTKQMAAVQIGVGSFPCTRLMTLAEQTQLGGGIRSLYSQSPSLTMKVAEPPTPKPPYDTNNYLRPSTTYYVTIVNRNPDGTASTTRTNNEVRVHFNN